MVALNQVVEILTEERFEKLAQYCNDNGLLLDAVDETHFIVKQGVTEADREQTRIQKEIYELEARLKELSQDIVQIQCGADFGTRIDDEGNEISIADERVAEFREKHNRLRYLKGKEPREYK